MNRIFVFVSILLLSSCSEDPVITSSIEGRWKGTLAEIQVKPFGLPIPYEEERTIDLRIAFTEEGVMVIENDNPPKEGTWQLSDDKLTIGIDYSIEEIDLSGTYMIERLTEAELVCYRKIKGQVLVNPDNGPNVTGQVKVTLHFRRM